MRPGARRLLHLSALVAGGTGLAWAYCAYLWDPGPEPEDLELLLEWTGQHPWVPMLRTVHLFSVPALVFTVGLIWASHVAPRLRTPWARRRSGLVLALLMLPMVVSGVALQTATSPEARELWVWTHGLSSGIWVLGYVVHQLVKGSGRRAPRRDGPA